MNVEYWKNYLRNENKVRTDTDFKDDERIIRKAISELRKEGILYIPVKELKHLYFRAELLSDDTVEQFANSQIKHLATQYFNTVKPLKDYVSDQKLKKLMEAIFE